MELVVSHSLHVMLCIMYWSSPFVRVRKTMQSLLLLMHQPENFVANSTITSLLLTLKYSVAAAMQQYLIILVHTEMVQPTCMWCACLEFTFKHCHTLALYYFQWILSWTKQSLWTYTCTCYSFEGQIYFSYMTQVKLSTPIMWLLCHRPVVFSCVMYTIVYLCLLNFSSQAYSDK